MTASAIAVASPSCCASHPIGPVYGRRRRPRLIFVQELLPGQTLARGVVKVLCCRIAVPPVFHLADVLLYMLDEAVQLFELVSRESDTSLPWQFLVVPAHIVLSDVDQKDVLLGPDANFHFFLVAKVIGNFLMSIVVCL